MTRFSRMATALTLLFLVGCDGDKAMLERAVADRDDTIADLEARVSALQAKVKAGEATTTDLSDSQACVRRQDEVIADLRTEATRSQKECKAARDQASTALLELRRTCDELAATKTELLTELDAREQKITELEKSLAEAREQARHRPLVFPPQQGGAQPKQPQPPQRTIADYTDEEIDALALKRAEKPVADVAAKFARAGSPMSEDEIQQMLKREFDKERAALLAQRKVARAARGD